MGRPRRLRLVLLVLALIVTPSLSDASAHAVAGTEVGGEGIVRLPKATDDAPSTVLARGSELDSIDPSADLASDSGRLAYVYDAPAVARGESDGVLPVEGAPSKAVARDDAAQLSSVAAGGAATTPAALTSTPRAVGAPDDAFTHGYSYHPRIRARGLQDPVSLNVPYLYDDVILRSTPVRQADGSLLYRTPGSINGKDGFFEIALNPDTGTIFHRTFVGG